MSLVTVYYNILLGVLFWGYFWALLQGFYHMLLLESLIERIQKHPDYSILLKFIQ